MKIHCAIIISEFKGTVTQCCGSEVIFVFGPVSGSGFNLNFGSGFGSGMLIKNTFKLKIIQISQKSKFVKKSVHFFYSSVFLCWKQNLTSNRN
jgi:hypothetical protein